MKDQTLPAALPAHDADVYGHPYTVEGARLVRLADLVAVAMLPAPGVPTGRPLRAAMEWVVDRLPAVAPLTWYRLDRGDYGRELPADSWLRFDYGGDVLSWLRLEMSPMLRDKAELDRRTDMLALRLDAVRQVLGLDDAGAATMSEPCQVFELVPPGALDLRALLDPITGTDGRRVWTEETRALLLQAHEALVMGRVHPGKRALGVGAADIELGELLGIGDSQVKQQRLRANRDAEAKAARGRASVRRAGR